MKTSGVYLSPSGCELFSVLFLCPRALPPTSITRCDACSGSSDQHHRPPLAIFRHACHILLLHSILKVESQHVQSEQRFEQNYIKCVSRLKVN